jgi:hypothetical protein
MKTLTALHSRKALGLVAILGLLACGEKDGAVVDGGRAPDAAADRAPPRDGEVTRDAGMPDAAPPKADFFVATDGSDAWSGTLAAPNATHTDGPFATVGRAQTAVRTVPVATRTTPITVLIRGGIFALSSPLTFVKADSGSAAVPIVYTAYPGELPILSGGVVVPGLAAAAGGVYTATLAGVTSGAWDFAELWVNGQRRYRTRTTPSAYLTVASPVLTTEPEGAGCSAGQDSTSATTCFDRFHYSGTDLDPSWYRLADGDVEIAHFINWTMPRMRIKSVDASTHTVQFTGEEIPYSFLTIASGQRYIAENVKESLTAAGSFYLDHGTGLLSYVPNPGETVSSITVVAPRLTSLVEATNVSYVTFRGLEFAYTSYTVPAAGYVSGQSTAGMDHAIVLASSANLTFDGCIFAHFGANGLAFNAGTNNTLVTGSIIEDLGGTGIDMGQSQVSSDTETNVVQANTVEQSSISGGGRFVAAAYGVYVQNTHNDTFENNDVFDFYNTGIGLQEGYTGSQSHDILVEHNLVYDLGQTITSDMGAIYNFGGSPGTMFEGNVAHDVTEDPNGYGGWGIYLDEDTQNLVVQNNLVYNVTRTPFFLHFGQGNSVTNNILAFGAQGQFERGDDDQGECASGLFPCTSSPTLWFTATHNLVYFTGSGGALYDGWNWDCTAGSGTALPCTDFFPFDTNLYFNTAGAVTFNGNSLAQWQALGEDVHSIVADPGFTDPVDGDFSIKDPSVAMSIGFVPFDPSLAGRSPGAALSPESVPAGYPTVSSGAP